MFLYSNQYKLCTPSVKSGIGSHLKMSVYLCFTVKVDRATVSVWTNRPPEAGELGDVYHYLNAWNLGIFKPARLSLHVVFVGFMLSKGPVNSLSPIELTRTCQLLQCNP